MKTTNKFKAAFQFSMTVTPAIQAQTNDVQRRIFLGGVFTDMMFARAAAVQSGNNDSANVMFDQLTRLAQEYGNVEKKISTQTVVVD